MPWPWLFLLVTIVGALFTFNAYLPRPANSLLAVPSFFAGWLTSELVAHHFAWQLAATLFFVWAGALAAWPGWLGLGITLASWAALLAMLPVARGSEREIEGALRNGLGTGYREAAAPSAAKLRDAFEPIGRLVNPFRFSHPKVRVQRTWAPRGRTPLLRHRQRRERISVISGVSVSPRRRRLGLHFRLHPKNIQHPEVCDFLRHLLRHLYRFPGYAPELNPDEGVWQLAKRALANGRPNSQRELMRRLRAQLARLHRSARHLRGCVRASDLSLILR